MPAQANNDNDDPMLTLFLSGDVMTGRGVDQALPHSVEPKLYESYISDARDYLGLAEHESGTIDTPLGYDYVWGDALQAWERHAPAFKLINLETSITTSDSPWPGKGIHYRMHPANIEILTAADIDYASLANNHMLDWGRVGLKETMTTLAEAGIAFSGAGATLEQAREPAILETQTGRVLVFSYGSPTSGVPFDWAAESGRSGVNLLPSMDDDQVEAIKAHVEDYRRAGDIVVFSVHSGGNWGYEVPTRQRLFAHALVERAGVDIIHGHSSHHPIGIEVHQGKLIVYGAGDFINDYEGIGGHERYRGELSLMYFPTVDAATGRLAALKMLPMKMRRLRLNHASADDARWLQQMLSREGEPFGTGARLDDDGAIWLEWQ